MNAFRVIMLILNILLHRSEKLKNVYMEILFSCLLTFKLKRGHKLWEVDCEKPMRTQHKHSCAQ
jgi:hypothetical protein